MKSDEPTSPSLLTIYSRVAAFHRVSRDIFVTAGSRRSVPGTTKVPCQLHVPLNLDRDGNAKSQQLTQEGESSAISTCYWTLMVKTSEWVMAPLVSVMTAFVVPAGVPPFTPPPLLPPLPQPHPSTAVTKPTTNKTNAASRRA